MIQLFRSLDFVHEHLKIQLLGAFLIEVEIFHDTGRMVPRAPPHKWTTKPQGLGESSRARPETQLRSLDLMTSLFVVLCCFYQKSCSEHVLNTSSYNLCRQIITSPSFPCSCLFFFKNTRLCPCSSLTNVMPRGPGGFMHQLELYDAGAKKHLTVDHNIC